MGKGEEKTRCKIEFTPSSLEDLAKLDLITRQRIFDSLSWMADHCDKIRHEGLSNLPKELVGLKKRRVGDYRVIYWYYRKEQIIRIYGVSHRSIVYKHLRR